MSEADNVIPMEKAAALPAPTGVTGLIQYSGRMAEEFLQVLSGEKALRVWREMRDNDPIVGAVLFAVDMLMRQVDWRVDAVDDTDAAAKAAALFVEECIEDLDTTWSESLSSILSMLPFGWSYHETLYKRRQGEHPEDPTLDSRYTDGKVGWRKFEIRAQETLFKWEFDEEGKILGMWQQAPPRWEPTLIPIEKALLFRTSAPKNNPEGRSILRNAYRPWYYKKRIEEIEAIGIERDLAGLPVAYIPAQMLSAGATADEVASVAAIKKILAGIKRDEQEGVVFPMSVDEKGNKRFELSLLSTGGRRQFDTTAIIARYESSIAQSVMADFIMLGRTPHGSYALGTAKMDMFSMALGAWLDMIAEVFNLYAIPRLFELNNMDLKLCPSLTHADVKRVDLAELGAYITGLSQAGAPMFPDEVLENYMREVANLPEKSASAVVGTADAAQAKPAAAAPPVTEPGQAQPGQAQPKPAAPQVGAPKVAPAPAAAQPGR